MISRQEPARRLLPEWPLVPGVHPCHPHCRHQTVLPKRRRGRQHSRDHHRPRTYHRAPCRGGESTSISGSQIVQCHQRAERVNFLNVLVAVDQPGAQPGCGVRVLPSRGTPHRGILMEFRILVCLHQRVRIRWEIQTRGNRLCLGVCFVMVFATFAATRPPVQSRLLLHRQRGRARLPVRELRPAREQQNLQRSGLPYDPLVSETPNTHKIKSLQKFIHQRQFEPFDVIFLFQQTAFWYPCASAGEPASGTTAMLHAEVASSTAAWTVCTMTSQDPVWLRTPTALSTVRHPQTSRNATCKPVLTTEER